jgi:hypothetical protein
MDCDIDRILSYISCYSATTDMKEAADYRFTRLIKELQDVLHGEAARLKEGSNFDPKLYVSEPNFSRHHRRRFNRAADGGRRILHRASHVPPAEPEA